MSKGEAVGERSTDMTCRNQPNKGVCKQNKTIQHNNTWLTAIAGHASEFQLCAHHMADGDRRKSIVHSPHVCSSILPPCDVNKDRCFY